MPVLSRKIRNDGSGTGRVSDARRTSQPASVERLPTTPPPPFFLPLPLTSSFFLSFALTRVAMSYSSLKAWLVLLCVTGLTDASPLVTGLVRRDGSGSSSTVRIAVCERLESLFVRCSNCMHYGCPSFLGSHSRHRRLGPYLSPRLLPRPNIPSSA